MKFLKSFVIVAILALVATSCEKTKINHTGAAKFVLKNITTGEEKTFESEELGYNSPLLTIRNNDSLQVKFVPELEYVKHNFEVVFTIFNDNRITDNEYPYLYKMKVTDITPDTYIFKCTATVDESDISISESGTGRVEVVE
jgi:hypothetical protein